MLTDQGTQDQAGAGASDDGKDVLIVVSKLKNYIRSKAGMNTSNGVAQVLSQMVREICDQAVARAQADGRKTVMDRDLR